MSELRTQTLGSYWFPADDAADDVHIAIIEHYEIIDPELPREERFRTDHIAVEVNDREWVVAQDHLLELAEMFLRAGRHENPHRITIAPAEGANARPGATGSADPGRAPTGEVTP